MDAAPSPAILDSWARCMSEHALFIELGIVADRTLAERAGAERERWESLRGGARDGGAEWAESALSLSADLAALKGRVLGRMQGGEWLGWILPSFVRHMLDELLHFTGLLERAAGRTSSGPGRMPIGTGLSLMAEDASEVARLIDPSEPKLVREARALAGGFQSLSTLSRGPGGGVVDLSVRAARELDRWMVSSGLGTPRVRSAVHPALAAHVAREAAMFVQEATQAAGPKAAAANG